MLTHELVDLRRNGMLVLFDVRRISVMVLPVAIFADGLGGSTSGLIHTPPDDALASTAREGGNGRTPFEPFLGHS